MHPWDVQGLQWIDQFGLNGIAMTTPDQDSFNTSADNDQEAAPLDEKSATGGDLAQQPAGTAVSSGEPQQLIADQDQTPNTFGD